MSGEASDVAAVISLNSKVASNGQSNLPIATATLTHAASSTTDSKDINVIYASSERNEQSMNRDSIDIANTTANAKTKNKITGHDGESTHNYVSKVQLGKMESMSLLDESDHDHEDLYGDGGNVEIGNTQIGKTLSEDIFNNALKNEGQSHGN